jgi:hypothetical protein
VGEAGLYTEPMRGSIEITERTKAWVPTPAGPGISAGYVEPGRYPVEAFGRVSSGGVASEYYVLEVAPGERVAVRASACRLEATGS